MDNNFFGRIYRLTIGEANKQGVEITSPMRIAFEITKTETPNGNTAKITINNLSDKTRSAIQKGMKLNFDAGYFEAGNLEMVFSGEITNVSHDITKPEIVTVVDVVDGYAAYKTVWISKTWGKGTPIKNILTEAIKKTGFAVGALPAITASTTMKKAFNGHAVDLIQKICDIQGLRWSVQNGTIKVYKKDEVDGTASVKSVLIGSPRRVFKKQTGQETTDFVGWEIDCLLLPKADVGGTITFTSRDNKDGASIQVTEVKHSGDNFGDKWTTTIKGRSVINGKTTTEAAKK